MKSVVKGIFLASLQCRDYTLKEKFNLWRGKAQSGVSPFWNETLRTNLAEEIHELKLPVYFFEGVYDYTCSTQLAKNYFQKLKAPVKGLYIFEHSAHSPLYEEPKKMQQLLIKDVLNETNTFSDIKLNQRVPPEFTGE
jgi:pimeloyl-ACP methyl ester carboxylesterase